VRERLGGVLDDRGEPLGDQMRALMDPLWYSLSSEEHEYLNSRGEIDIRLLYPVTLAVSDLYQVPAEQSPSTVEVLPENGVGRRFSLKEAIPWAA